MRAMSDLEPQSSAPSGDLPAWRQYLSIAGSVMLGGVFLVAAWAKSIDPESFADLIRGEGLEILLPASAIALFVLFLEWALGFALLLAVRWRWLLATTSGLVLFFVFLTGRKYWRWSQGLEVESSCGCFGNLVQRTPGEAFWQDLLLMGPALLLAWLGASAVLPRWRAVAALVVGLVMTVFAWRAPELPIDHIATRLHVDMNILEHCIAGAEDSQVCMDAILPELRDGDHVVIIAPLDNTTFLEAVPTLNERALDAMSGETPSLWVLTPPDDEAIFTFRFSQGPIFELREAPEPLTRPLYRRLPRSFTVTDGRVTAAWNGLPPDEAYGP
ncbi:MAG: MauE/DoxX family redox-associated membrane protein [Acidobacteriota bacterium]